MKIEIDGKKLLLEKISKEAVRKAVRIPDVWIHYALHKTEYMGESMIIMESIVENNFTPMRLKHLSDAVSETLRWACENGFRVFDYGGAGSPNKPYGVRLFKSQMGGELVEYGRYEKVHKPLLMKIAKLGFSILRNISSKRN